MNDHLQVTGHIISLGAIISSMVGLLPAIAALGAIIWYMVSIYETKTVQDWLARRRERSVR